MQGLESGADQRLAVAGAGLQVSLEWIHQHVHADKRRGGEFHIHLRCRKLRRKRYGSHDRRGQIRGRIPIDKWPGLVEERSRIGDWEADTVIEKLGGSVLVTLAEHKTRYSVIAKAPATQQPTPKMSGLKTQNQLFSGINSPVALTS